VGNHKYPEEGIEIFAEEERLLAIPAAVFYVLWELEEGIEMEELEIFAEKERLLAAIPASVFYVLWELEPES
jgi:hypothetical protein